MSKLSLNEIQKAMQESNDLEFDLSTDEAYRELDQYEDGFDYDAWDHLGNSDDYSCFTLDEYDHGLRYDLEDLYLE